MDYQKIFAKNLSEKGLLSRIYMEIKNWQKIGNRILKIGKWSEYSFLKEAYKWQKEKECLLLLAITEIQIKASRYYFTPVRANTKRDRTKITYKDVEQKGLLHTVSGNAELV